MLSNDGLCIKIGQSLGELQAFLSAGFVDLFMGYHQKGLALIRACTLIIVNTVFFFKMVASKI